MNFIKKEFYFDSGSGLCKVHAASYLPLEGTEIEAIFQIAHGMTEHIERYEPFIEKLCESGFAVYANDHIGHGQSVASEDDLGYFGEKDGWKHFVGDCHKLSDIAREEVPDKPLIFFGHSMGSFIARKYSLDYATEIKGAVFCGTAPPNPILGFGKLLTKILKVFFGSRYRAALVNKIAFGAYNKRFDGPTSYEWLTRDRDIIDAYMEDPHCGFLFTLVGYHDMLSVLGEVSSKSWFENFSKKMPVLMISGTDDPVGNYGKGVRQVYDKLKKVGKENLDIILYEKARHELLNESEYFEKVCTDVITWAKKALK